MVDKSTFPSLSSRSNLWGMLVSSVAKEGPSVLLGLMLMGMPMPLVAWIAITLSLYAGHDRLAFPPWLFPVIVKMIFLVVPRSQTLFGSRASLMALLMSGLVC